VQTLKSGDFKNLSFILKSVKVMPNLQIYYVELGGINYTVTNEELPAQLKLWKKQLKKEGKHPQEATIHVYNQLQTIEKQLKKAEKGHSIEVHPPANSETTLLSLDSTSIAILAAIIIGVTVFKPSKSSTTVQQLKLVDNPINIGGITFYNSTEDFNKYHPK
jgi:hypothetical protein